MRDGVAALRKNVRAHSRLIIQQGTFVWICGGRVHPWSEVDEDTVVAVSALDDDSGRIGTEAGGVHEIFGGEDTDLRGPLECRERLIERQADRVIVGDEARRFTGALKEVRERVGAIFEGAQYARGCGNGHLEIITKLEFNC